MLKDLEKKKDEIIKLHQELENKTNIYKAECKKLLGVCEGEQMDVLSTAIMIERIVNGTKNSIIV